MTQSRRNRRLSHVIVDLFEIAGGGMLADGVARHSIWTFLISLAVIGIGLVLDRRNALQEEKQDG